MIKYYAVYYEPDLDSGIKEQVIYIRADWGGDSEVSSLMDNSIADYCYQEYGNKVIRLSDGRYTESWSIFHITDGVFDTAKALTHPNSLDIPNKLSIIFGASNIIVKNIE